MVVVMAMTMVTVRDPRRVMQVALPYVQLFHKCLKHFVFLVARLLVVLPLEYEGALEYLVLMPELMHTADRPV